MKHKEWRKLRCPFWDFSCLQCFSKPCLDDPEYEEET